MTTPDTAQDRRTNHDHSVRIALLEQSMSSIKEELHAINGNLSKLVWVVIIGIVAAAVQFMIRGGLVS